MRRVQKRSEGVAREGSGARQAPAIVTRMGRDRLRARFAAANRARAEGGARAIRAGGGAARRNEGSVESPALTDAPATAMMARGRARVAAREIGATGEPESSASATLRGRSQGSEEERFRVSACSPSPTTVHVAGPHVSLVRPAGMRATGSCVDNGRTGVLATSLVDVGSALLHQCATICR